MTDWLLVAQLSSEVRRLLKARDQCAPARVQERDSRPDWPTSQRVVLERLAEELAVESERHYALVHIEVNAQDALLFKRLAVLAALSVATVAQLAEAVEAETKIVVAKSVRNAELLLRGHSDLEFVLGARICNDLPVVLTVHERSV